MPLGRNPSGNLDRSHRHGGEHDGDIGRAAIVADHVPVDKPAPLAPIPVKVVGPIETAPERLERPHISTVAITSQTIPTKIIGEDRYRTRLFVQVPASAPCGVLVGVSGNALQLGLGFFLAPGTTQEFPAGGALSAVAGGPIASTFSGYLQVPIAASTPTQVIPAGAIGPVTITPTSPTGIQYNITGQSGGLNNTSSNPFTAAAGTFPTGISAYAGAATAVAVSYYLPGVFASTTVAILAVMRED